MTKRVLIYTVLQTIALIIAFFVLGIALAGGHKIKFSNIGSVVAAIMITFLLVPLIYSFTQRNKLKNGNRLLTISVLIFLYCLILIFIGVPTFPKQFIIKENGVNQITISQNTKLNIQLKLEPEMFNRVFIEATINKTDSIQIEKIDLVILNNKNEIIKPVFQPLAWDSLHVNTIQMNSFFEPTIFSKMNRFSLTAQYSIDNTESLKIDLDYTFRQNGHNFSNYKQIQCNISKHLVFEELIER